MSRAKTRTALIAISLALCAGIFGVLATSSSTNHNLTVTALKGARKSRVGNAGVSSGLALADWHVVQAFGALRASDFGWVATDKVLLMTSDSGETWSTAQLPSADQILALQFDSPTHALAIVHGATPQEIVVLATTDGAESWATDATIKVDAPGGIVGASLSAAAQAWWLILTDATGSQFSRASSWMSTNGGASWSTTNPLTPGGNVVALDGRNAVLVGGAGSQEALATKDGGVSWTKLDLDSALGAVPSSEPTITALGSPVVDGKDVLVPGIRNIGPTDERSFVLDIRDGVARLLLARDGAATPPVPLDLGHTLVGNQLVESGGDAPISGTLPNAAALIGPTNAVGVRTDDSCDASNACTEINTIMTTPDLTTWTPLSTSQNALPSPSSSVPSTTVDNTPTAAQQVLASGDAPGGSWSLVAAPTASGLCYGIGYDGPKASTCITLPKPAPPILAVVNRDPAVALGVVRSDVSSVIIRFVSGKTMHAELRPAPDGFPKGQWYAAPVPVGEIVTQQQPVDVSGNPISQ